jgi:acetyl esterase/lipase
VKNLFLTFTLAVTSLLSQGQQQNIIIYPDGIPGSKKIPADYAEYTDEDGYIHQVSQPALIPFFPEKTRSTNCAVIICPGGGYELVVATDEGYDVAKAFTEMGISAFVLKYRLPNEKIMNDKTMGPLQDLQQAIKILRQRAAEFQIDTNKIGVVGLSAGGHLASTAGTHFDIAAPENSKKVNLRPDFMILVYPVISFGLPGAPRSKANLIDKDPSEEVVNFFSNERHVTSNTPPTFLLHAADDRVVSVKNSTMFFEALIKANVKSELHVVQEGGHGFALDNPSRSDKWMDWCKEWMTVNGFVK